MLAEETGGIAVVNQNDFDKALKRIDAESSDYYVLGYYSSNPDPTTAPAADRGEGAEAAVIERDVPATEYVLKPPPRPASTARAVARRAPRRSALSSQLYCSARLRRMPCAFGPPGRAAARSRRARRARPLPPDKPRRYPTR